MIVALVFTLVWAVVATAGCVLFFTQSRSWQAKFEAERALLVDLTTDPSKQEGSS